ncbi:hypothetical protein GpartN1_g2479.t1 [Galdieria partita]|uniref:Protein transport protein Sec24-like protein n=1 Tax=Galdieria partita TaxID=83374 RepID=A0A9C7UPB0_9RHOD|nr:hypothetical protein GpartN1_g2479.t1 [Galdieria partita]
MSDRQSQLVGSNQVPNANVSSFRRYAAQNPPDSSNAQDSWENRERPDPRLSQGSLFPQGNSVALEGSRSSLVQDFHGFHDSARTHPVNSGTNFSTTGRPFPGGQVTPTPNQTHLGQYTGTQARVTPPNVSSEPITTYNSPSSQVNLPYISRLRLSNAQYSGAQLCSGDTVPKPKTGNLVGSDAQSQYTAEAKTGVLQRPGLIPRPGIPQTSYPAASQPGVALATDTQQLPRPDLSSFGIALRVREGDISENYLASLNNAVNTRNQTGSQNLTSSAESTVNAAVNNFLPVACSEEVFKPVHPSFMRISVGMFPNAPTLRSRFPLPVGAIVQPLAEPPVGEQSIPVVNFGKAGIIRCRRCRAYINYLSMFVDGGRKFRCNFCGFLSDVPSDYYCPLDNSGRRLDANERPELTCGSVDFVAPSEYMVRPPMPPTYLFVIDVSASSVSCGALNCFISSIRQSLDFLLGEDRTRIGIITFDSTVHFYGLKSSSENLNGKLDPIMAVVSDVDDVFLPIPHGCLVKLQECRESLEILLDRLENMFAISKDGGGAVGPAVSAGFLLLQSCGGRLVLMTSSRPTLGVGALSKSALEGGERSSPNIVGTDKERQYLEPDNTFYKKTAVNMSRAQISCDILLCSGSNIHSELATLTPLAKYTGGEILYLSRFEASKDYIVLIRSLRRMVSRETAWEGVMRIRCTRSVKCHGFLGRFFMRSTDLLTLPNTDSDKTYGVEFVLEDNDIRTEAFAAQCAVLYTASGGERRVRIHTIAIPVTRNMADLFCYADIGSMTNLIMRTCADAVLNKNFETVRKEVTESLVQALVKYQQGGSQLQSQYSAVSNLNSQLVLPQPLRLLPLCIQGILKSPLLSREASIAASMLLDDKSFLHSLVDIFSVALSSAYVYPNIVPLFPLDEESNANQVGMSLPGGPLSVKLPEGLRASAAHVLHSHRVVLIDEGISLWIWFGSSVKPSFVQELVAETSEEIASVFGTTGSISPQYIARAFLCTVKPGYTSSASRARAVVQSILACRLSWTPVRVVFQGDPLEARILSLMVEDRTVNQPSYTEFLSSIQRQVQSRLTSS